MKQLSIKKIALYGFGAVITTFIIAIVAAIFYVHEIEMLEKESSFYEKSYNSLFEFKYYTERLLTTENLKAEMVLWSNSKDNFDNYFKAIQHNKEINYEDFVTFWHVIDDESKKIEIKLQNTLFDKSNTQERALLRRLGEGLNTNKSSDYYLALSDLKNSIDYIKQYEEFLLDELKVIKSQKISHIFDQIKKAKKSGIIFISIFMFLSFSILYYVVSLIAKVEEKLINSLEDLKISNDETELLNSEILENYEKTLFALVDILEERDTYTGGHSQRVAKYSVRIAQEMGYGKKELEKIYQAGMLHDIGKMNIPDSILLKPGKLDDVEYVLIKSHAQNGYKFLKQIPMYLELANIIHFHHERYDGKGYPAGKKGDEIDIISYILSVADAFDAMTTSRIYKGRKNIEEALLEIEKYSGTQFHPEVVKATIKVLKDTTIDVNISQLPTNILEMERFSYFYKDKVSGVFNEQYLDLILTKQCHEQKTVYIDVFFMSNFNQYNINYGWSEGSKLLAEFAQYLKNSLKDALVFRVHGDDFIVLHQQETPIEKSFYTKLDFMKETLVTIHHKRVQTADKNICNFKELELLL